MPNIPDTIEPVEVVSEEEAVSRFLLEEVAVPIDFSPVGSRVLEVTSTFTQEGDQSDLF